MALYDVCTSGMSKKLKILSKSCSVLSISELIFDWLDEELTTTSIAI